MATETNAEYHARWERYYWEAHERDLLRTAYKQADEEDAKFERSKAVDNAR